MLGQNYPFGEQIASVYGYPAVSDVSKRIFMQYGGSGFISKIHDENIFYKIKTTQGQSGSPIIVEFVSGLFFAVGIHNKSIQFG
jgi:V8-like Glu-specific endopeptidase